VSLRSAVAKSRGVLCETSVKEREGKAGRWAGVREEGKEGGREREREEQETRTGTSTWENKRVRVLTEHFRSGSSYQY